MKLMEPFKNIFQYSVVVTGNKRRLHMCSDQFRIAMQKLWAMIEWEHNAFLKDCNRIGSLNDWPENDKKWDRFYTRNVARTFSYINLACNLDFILKKCFDDTVMRGNHWFPNKFVEAIPKSKIANVLYDYRNKLVAHPAAAKPYPKDKAENDTTHLTSLLYIQGGSFIGNDPRSFQFGGTKVVANGEGCKYFKDRFGIYTSHDEVKKYFSDCSDLLYKMLKHYSDQCPISNDGYTFTTKIITSKS